MNIRVSEKHGVNPSMGVCFWCGEDDGTVLLVGRLPGDVEAPHRMIANDQPCDKCRENMAKGITLFEASDKPAYPNQAVLTLMGSGEKYPTGRWFVVAEDFVRRVFDRESAKAVIDKHMAGIDSQVADWIQKQNEALQAANDETIH